MDKYTKLKEVNCVLVLTFVLKRFCKIFMFIISTIYIFSSVKSEHSVPFYDLLHCSFVAAKSFLTDPFLFLNLIPASHDVFLFENIQRGNFRCTDSSVGVETQLSNLAEITQVIDPKLHQHLGISLKLCFLISVYLAHNTYPEKKKKKRYSL